MGTVPSQSGNEPSLRDTELGEDKGFETTGPYIVICIPAFNEEKTIGHIVSQSKMYGRQILVCDDGSVDHTSDEASKNGAIVMTHTRNVGKGAALKSLLQEANKLNPDVIVTLDADGQHDPSDIPILTTPVLHNQADVVVGCRFNGNNHIPSYRRLGNSLLSRMTNWSAGTRILDTQSGFRAYSSKVVPWVSIKENGMGVDSEILINLAKKGFRIEERNITVTYSGDTSTLNPVSHIVRVVWSIVLGKYRSLGRLSTLGWTVALGTVISTIILLSLAKVPFSSFGMGASMLAFVAGVLAIVSSPSGRFIRWIRRDRPARPLGQEN